MCRRKVVISNLRRTADFLQTFEVTAGDLLDKAHALAESLGGEVCDETRSILTEQTIGHIKEKVEAFRFKQQMAAMKQRRHER